LAAIWITLKGKGDVYYTENFAETPDNWDDIDLEDFWWLENEWLDGNLYETALIMELEGVYVGQDEWEEAEDITKKKGKYIKRTDIFKSDQGLTPPFYVRCINGGTDICNSFCIELNDEEEFDPSQLQLEKSDYELEFLPYGIVSQYIIYKGEKIHSYSETEYRDKGCNRPFVCHEFYN
jgi:hypothetical protein